jgi:hypothetical protein
MIENRHIILWGRVLTLLVFMTVGLAASPSLTATVGTTVPEYITTNTTWTEEGSPYRVDVRVIVNQGVTLTIEPGVTVESANIHTAGYSVEVAGRLRAGQCCQTDPLQDYA